MKTDKELQKDILNELEWNPSIDSSKVGVSVDHGIVTLSGEVTHYSDKDQSEKIVKNVSGVRGIANHLEVKLLGTYERTDTDIVEAALHALKWAASVPDERIKVIVNHGELTLEGKVDWHFQKSAAYNAVKGLLGVKDVYNLIEVVPMVKAKEVKHKIREALHRNAEIDVNHIEVETQDDKVILRGTVKAYNEKEAAEHAAWNAPGVARVVNEISIR